MKTCTKCNELKPLEAYSKNKAQKDGLRTYCKVCANTQAKKYKETSTRRFARYGLSVEGYNAMLERQNGACLCGATEPGRGFEYFCVDHDHACCPGEKSCGKCVRGLLCHACNVALGLLNDDVDRMMALAAYLLQNKNIIGEIV